MTALKRGIGLVLLSLTSACATVTGIGQDVSALGQGISHVAQEVREEVFHSESAPQQEKQIRYVPTATAQEPCDPAPYLAGGRGLKPCPQGVLYR